MASGWRYPLFFLILAVYLLAGVLFATLTPDWQAPDEPAHYNYIRYLAEQRDFPELVAPCYNSAYLERLKSQRFPPQLSIDTVCYEFHQPPLYYLLATPIFFLSEGSLLALRLLSVALGAGVVALAFVIAQTIFPNRPAIAYGTMAFVAFVPMHVAMLAAVNNDALAELILAVLLLLLTRRLAANSRATRRNDIVLGILLGLALITKTTVYIAVPLVAVTLWLARRAGERGSGGGEEQRSRGAEEQGRRGGEEQASEETAQAQAGQSCEGGKRDWLILVRQAGLIYGLALAVALPWYMRNATLYGNFDLLGMARHNAVVVGQLRTTDFLAQVGQYTYLQDFVITTFNSFWGQFGWMAVPLSQRAYLALTLLTLAALAGVVAFWTPRLRSGQVLASKVGENILSDAPRPTPHVPHPMPHALRPTPYQALLLMASAIIFLFLGYIWYNLEFVQFQGRYLFSALIPLGIFFSLGLAEAFSPRWTWGLVAGLAVALGWAVLTSLSSGDLNRWAVLIIGLPLALAVGRVWLASRWPVPVGWPLTLVYVGLALLTLISPFWYVIPYLSP